ncbi:hypothetical protein [Duganella sp. sic0402]|nr:hypothetical protein [Duganella sp. sic0402]
MGNQHAEQKPSKVLLAFLMQVKNVAEKSDGFLARRSIGRKN